MIGDFDVDHQGMQWRLDYYRDSLQGLVDAGRLDEAVKSKDLHDSLLSLIELIDMIEEANHASND
jgi:CYTH domain-containing protein